MQQKTDTVELIVYACVVLHNLLIEKRPQEYLTKISDQANPYAPTLEWQEANTLANLQATGRNQGVRRCKGIRDHLKEYYNDVGAIDWQEIAVNKWVKFVHI